MKKAFVLLFIFFPVISSWAFNPATGDFSPENSDDLRILSWNAHRDFMVNSEKDAPFDRILKTINANIIVFQEFNSDVQDSEILSHFTSIFPDSNWYLHRGQSSYGFQNIIVSRFPLSMTRVDTIPETSLRGVTIALNPGYLLREIIMYSEQQQTVRGLRIRWMKQCLG
jgi:endonuclease/exonuclease/phosphatase family protein